jgi:lipid-binding SYLF domain-containing protein
LVKQLSLVLVATLALIAFPCQRLFAQGRMAGTLWSASEVLDDLRSIPLKGIPPTLLRGAEGVAIIPHAVKAGLIIGGRFGEGLVMVRNPDGTWSNPVFISLAGGSFGWQIGVQSADIVLVFRSRRSLDRVLQGKGKLTLGADVAVAAGPVGRQAEAGTDAKLQAEIYSYSRSRGLFAGLALEGAAILNNGRLNEEFSQRPRPEEIQAAERLKGQLAVLGGLPAAIYPPPLPPPPATIVPPPLPPQPRPYP